MRRRDGISSARAQSSVVLAKAWPQDQTNYRGVERALARCESPIERRFLLALLFEDALTFQPTVEGDAIAVDATGVVLRQQVAAGRYAIDFALTLGPARLGIELDGHWHERSPGQAERDRARERELVARGWRIVRFTGREVERCAVRCAVEAYRVFEKFSRPATAR
jgi:very-short-patch-repair endonuclease